MCKQETYSKYQKQAIKFLSEHLGTETPFTYERTQSNHLKILIEGLEKPMFTSSTPSDSKTLKNFMADVKRELKACKAEHPPSDQLTPKAVMANAITVGHEKLTQNCIKSLRSRLGIMKPQEQEQVLKNQSLDVVPNNRHEIIKRAIARALQERKQGAYIKPQEMKKIEKKLTQHLNFMMPTLADYSALLDNKSRYQKSGNHLDAQQTVVSNTAVSHSTASGPSLAQNTVQPIKSQITAVVEQTVAGKPSNTSERHHSAVELMAMSANNRVSLLRDLSKAQALQLIDDINHALSVNLEQDIAAVVALIKEKEIPLEAIISRVEMA